MTRSYDITLTDGTQLRLKAKDITEAKAKAENSPSNKFNEEVAEIGPTPIADPCEYSHRHAKHDTGPTNCPICNELPADPETGTCRWESCEAAADATTSPITFPYRHGSWNDYSMYNDLTAADLQVMLARVIARVARCNRANNHSGMYLAACRMAALKLKLGRISPRQFRQDCDAYRARWASLGFPIGPQDK